MRTLLAIFALVVVAPAARAQDLLELLHKGPVVSVENNAKGRFDRATAVVAIAAPLEQVWQVATNFSNYRYFMPKVLKSEPTRISPNVFDVRFEIDLPFSNSNYTFRYEIDEAKRVIHGHWVKGDLEGSFCEWRLVAYKDGTLLYYTAASRNFSSLAKRFDDDQQTLTIGLNVVAAVTVVKAVKRRVEGMTPLAGGVP